MHEPGVDADDELRAREQAGECRQRLPWQRGRGGLALREGFAARALVRRAPGQQHAVTGAREHRQQLPPVRMRPVLVGAARRVHADHVGSAVRERRSGGRWHEPVTRRTLDAVAERRARELPAAVDQVLAGIDRMVRVVRQRGDRLADARAVGPMGRPAGGCGDQRALHLLLQVEHRDIALPPQVDAECGPFAPRGR